MQLFLDILYPVILLMLGFSLICVAEVIKQVFGGDTRRRRIGYRVLTVGGILLLIMALIAVMATFFFGRHFILL